MDVCDRLVLRVLRRCQPARGTSAGTVDQRFPSEYASALAALNDTGQLVQVVRDGSERMRELAPGVLEHVGIHVQFIRDTGALRMYCSS